MAFKINLLPEAVSFDSNANESLLEAALRAGLSPDYGCSNGSCGRCQARLLSGKVRTIRPHDFVIPAHLRERNTILLCSCAATSDVQIETGTAHSGKDIPLQKLTAKVRRIDPAGDNTLFLQLRTPRSKTLRFIAGQHARLVLPNGLQRELPIASCPCDGMHLEFHIHRDSADCFTDYMFEYLKTSTPVDIEGPCGDFTLDDQHASPLLFIAWEVGFGPVRSLIEHCLSLEWQAPVYLYWIVQSKHDMYADGYCRAIDDAFDNMHYTALPVQNIDTAIAHISAAHEDLSGYQAFIAAPPAVAHRIKSELSLQHVKIDPLVA
jgi:CDP-4-dehydro-6-deoxyglucose reductase